MRERERERERFFIYIFYTSSLTSSDCGLGGGGYTMEYTILDLCRSTLSWREGGREGGTSRCARLLNIIFATVNVALIGLPTAPLRQRQSQGETPTYLLHRFHQLLGVFEFFERFFHFPSFYFLLCRW